MHPCGKYTRGSAGVCLRTKGLRSVPTLARRRHGPLSSQEGVGRGFSHVTQQRYKAEGGASALRGRCVRIFFEKAWLDGLPVVTPTEARVQRMLAGTRRNPDEVVGLIPPLLEPATVRTVAIQAWMAGCQPASLPVVLGGASSCCAMTST